jgi:hypothetical protein
MYIGSLILLFQSDRKILQGYFFVQKAAAFFAAAYRNATDDNAVDIILSYLLEDGLPDACVIMSWRFIANMFKTEALRSVALEAIDQITSVAALEFDKKSENVQAVIGSAMLKYDPFSRIPRKMFTFSPLCLQHGYCRIQVD